MHLYSMQLVSNQTSAGSQNGMGLKPHSKRVTARPRRRFRQSSDAAQSSRPGHHPPVVEAGEPGERQFNESEVFVLTRSVIETLRQATLQSSPLLGTAEFEDAILRLTFSFDQ